MPLADLPTPEIRPPSRLPPQSPPRPSRSRWSIPALYHVVFSNRGARG